MSTSTRLHRYSNNLKREGQRLINTSRISPVIETLMRLGFLVRGLIYGVMGLLAVQVAVVGRGTVADSQGAIVTMGKTPLGNGLLYVILVGLIGYSMWGVIRAVFDPLDRGTSLKGIVLRVGYAISAGSYALLALATYGLLTGIASAARNGAQTTQAQRTTASILSNSWGPWVIAIAGIALIGVGLAQVIQGVSRNFEQQFYPYALSNNQRLWIERLGRFGTAARGVVFTMLGVFLFLAAYHNDPHEAQGIDGVLTALLHQPYGPVLLGIVALGLVAFGIYSVMSGIWLRFKRSAT